MENTKKLIKEYEELFPQFSYYLPIIEIAASKIEKQPDIAIETCKALIEGVSKTLLTYFSVTYDEKTRNGVQVNKLFKDAVLKMKNTCDKNVKAIINSAKLVLSASDTIFEARAISHVISEDGSKLIHELNDIRNKRGDISHGKKSPKECVSDKHMAKSMATITDGVLSYVLGVFFRNFPTDKVDYDAPENQEFNLYLDEENDLGDIKYSKALYNQKPAQYRLELASYLETQEETI